MQNRFQRLLLGLLVAGACACDAGLSADVSLPPPDPTPRLQGQLAGTLDDQPLALAYDGVPAKLTLRHRSAGTGLGCVAQVGVDATLPDGTCRLELVFRPWLGAGLRLDQARLHVRTPQGQDCKAFADDPLVEAGEPVVYALHSGQATIARPAPLSAAQAPKSEVPVPGLFFQPAGQVVLKFQGHKLAVDLGQLPFGGEGVSTGDPQADCGPCGGPGCESPYPKWQAQDVQPKSKGYGMTYGLSAFQGRPLVVLLAAGWCPICVYQAGRLPALRKDLLDQGKDVAFVLVNMSNAAAPSLQKNLLDRCSFPVFQDTVEAGVFAAMAGEKNDYYFYHSDGTLQQKMPKVTGLAGPDSPGFLKVRDAAKALH